MSHDSPDIHINDVHSDHRLKREFALWTAFAFAFAAASASFAPRPLGAGSNGGRPPAASAIR